MSRLASLDVACDLCGSNQPNVRFASNISDPGFEHAVRSYSRQYGLREHFRIVECGACGFVYSSPRDSEDQTREIYSQVEDEGYGQGLAYRTKSLARLLSIVSRYCQEGRLLDVGSALGVFCDLARRQGFDVDGVELSAWGVRQAKELFEVDLIQQDFMQLEIGGGEYDAVCMWDFLEHVPSPTRALEKASDLLKSGGLLFIKVPNIESTSAKLMGEKWWLLLREHLNFLSPATARTLLDKTAFDLVGTHSVPTTFSVKYVLERNRHYSGLLGSVASLPLLDRLTVPVWLGEMTLVARKGGP